MFFNKRQIVVMILLQFITCGIYSAYWMITTQNDLRRNYQSESLPSGVMVFILSVVTFGIYYYFWVYKTAKVVNIISDEVGLGNPQDEVMMLILALFTFGFVFNIVTQDRINQIVEAM